MASYKRRAIRAKTRKRCDVALKEHFLKSYVYVQQIDSFSQHKEIAKTALMPFKHV
jgi:hypothetical protein